MTTTTKDERMSQRIMYLRDDGLLFVQFSKKQYPHLRTLRAAVENSTTPFYEHTASKGSTIFGEIVEVTNTGVILDKWEVKQ